MNPKEVQTLTEQCRLDMKDFRVYDQFRPNYNKPVTRKFYSVHETAGLSEIRPDIIHKLHKHCDYGPKLKHEFPETTNEEYGWYTEPFIPHLRSDSRFFHPVHSADFIKHEFRILADIMMKTPKFGGKPFFLQ